MKSHLRVLIKEWDLLWGDLHRYPDISLGYPQLFGTEGDLSGPVVFW